MDHSGRVIGAMQALDTEERGVRACLNTSHFHRDFGPIESSVSKKAAAMANLEAISERRKKLGRLYGLGLEGIQAANQLEVERLLTPLKLKDMTGWGGSRYDDDNIVLKSDRTHPRTTSPKAPFTTAGRKNSVPKTRRVRERKLSGGQYGSGHITKIFDPDNTIAKATRSNRVVEMEDDDDESEQEEEKPEELLQRPLSVASTGSNITVYRPSSVTADDVPQAATKLVSPRGKAPAGRPPSSRRREPPPSKKPKPQSVISVSSRETLDIDRLDEVEDTSGILQGSPTIMYVDPGQGNGDDHSMIPLSNLGSTQTGSNLLNETQTNVQDADQESVATSELSFATSNGTGLFVSDKRRPRKPQIRIAEGTILGGTHSNISFPTPSPGSVEKPRAATVPSTQDSNAVPKKKTRKRKEATANAPSEPSPSKSKKKRGGKSAIEVSDLVSAPSRRFRPSRATMTNGQGLLIGTSGVDERIMSTPPLSWQAKGRGKAVIRAKTLSEMAKEIAMEGNG